MEYTERMGHCDAAGKPTAKCDEECEKERLSTENYANDNHATELTFTTLYTFPPNKDYLEHSSLRGSWGGYIVCYAETKCEE